MATTVKANDSLGKLDAEKISDTDYLEQRKKFLKKPKTHIEAMISAQAAMSPLIKNKKAHQYSYADLGALYEACKLAFLENGFCILQTNDHDEYGAYVKTTLLHTSEKTFESKVYLYLSKPDMQGLGSAITYARRYGLMSISGLSAEEDDDGKNATQYPATSVKRSATAPSIPNSPVGRL